jgi:hypothetical protein
MGMPIPFYIAPPLIVIPAPQQAINPARIARSFRLGTYRLGGEQPHIPGPPGPTYIWGRILPPDLPAPPVPAVQVYDDQLDNYGIIDLPITIPATGPRSVRGALDTILESVNFTSSYTPPSSYVSTKKKMMFKDFGIRDQVSLIKNEFVALAKLIFEHPECIKDKFIDSKKLTNSQAKEIFLSVDKLNMADCSCCRKLNINLLKSRPVDKELEPLIDIAQSVAKSKQY